MGDLRHQSLRNKQRILVIGDYDAAGTLESTVCVEEESFLFDALALVGPCSLGSDVWEGRHEVTTLGSGKP